MHVSDKSAVHQHQRHFDQIDLAILLPAPRPIRESSACPKPELIGKSDGAIVTQPAIFPVEPCLRSPAEIMLPSPRVIFANGTLKSAHLLRQVRAVMKSVIAGVHAELETVLSQVLDDTLDLGMRR